MSEHARRTRLLFTDDQLKFIVDFYVQNHEIMLAPKNVNHADKIRLAKELTAVFNSTFGLQVTPKTIGSKIKSIKEFIKRKISNQRATMGNDWEPPPLMPEEAMIFEKVKDQPEFVKGTFRRPKLSVTGIKRPTKRTQFNNVHICTKKCPPDHNFVNASASGSTSTTTPRRQQSKSKNVRTRFLNDSATESLKMLKKSVLLLQKQVHENELKLQADKKSAVDEYRRYIGEKRMVARGVDLRNVPVEIPPGLDTANLEQQV